MILESTWSPKLVALYKAAEAVAPLAPAAAANEYLYGRTDNSGSLPVRYSLIGWLLRPPVVGKRVRILRCSRNGVVTPGLFTSTEVVKFPREGEFHTRNSVYLYEEIENVALPPDGWLQLPPGSESHSSLTLTRHGNANSGI